MFQLNKFVTVDAEKLGNEMRYLNDANETKCEAKGDWGNSLPDVSRCFTFFFFSSKDGQQRPPNCVVY